VRLSDGRVLVAGGITPEDRVVPTMMDSTEIYDPASNAWTAAADLSQARYSHVLVLLPDGQVLAVGGARDWSSRWAESSFVHEIERYDPVANRWRIVGELPQPRAYATATLLLDGRVWVTGGLVMETIESDTWLIKPSMMTQPYQPKIPAPAAVPASTKAPAATEAPAPTAVPAPTGAPSTPFPSPVNNDILVWYDFEGDFPASSKVADNSGNKYDAWINGNLGVTEGISGGQAISFSGNGYILAQNNPAAGRNTVSFSLWFKKTIN
jgi:hypothetical protein